MPRFVILSHDHPFPHWDLMLEAGESLRTWRLRSQPEAEGEIDAEELGAHRLAYLDYEGPISGGRGTVTRWDHGTYEWGEAKKFEVFLKGVRFQGWVVLRRASPHCG